VFTHARLGAQGWGRLHVSFFILGSATYICRPPWSRNDLYGAGPGGNVSLQAPDTFNSLMAEFSWHAYEHVYSPH